MIGPASTSDCWGPGCCHLLRRRLVDIILLVIVIYWSSDIYLVRSSIEFSDLDRLIPQAVSDTAYH